MTKKFRLSDSNIAKYQRIIGKEFIGIETNFLRRYEWPSRSSFQKPFSVFGNIDDYFKAEIKEQMTDGFLFFKRGYDFLQASDYWTVIKADVSISPSAMLYSYNGNFFVERGYMSGNIVDDDGILFRKLHGISQTLFQKIVFENIIGLFLDKNNDFEYLLYHTYSDGMTLDKITRKTPKPVKKYIRNLIVNAFKELNDNGINYTECQPTNFRYSFKDKIILNPHNCISFRDEVNDNVSDLACLLYTNDWMRADVEKTCEDYLNKKVPPRDLDKFVRQIKDEMLYLEAAGPSQVARWQERGIMPLH